MIDSSLSTVTADADKIMIVRKPEPCALNLEPQSSRDDEATNRMLLYGILVFIKYGLPVHSIMILLRKEADYPGLTGQVGYQSPMGSSSWLRFSFGIVKVWELPVENILDGGVGTLPLAPLAAVTREELPYVIRRMEDRIRQEVEPGEAALLWSATYILMGLRYPPELAGQLLQGVRNMKESTTYQAIIQEGRQEGRMEEARRMLLLMGGRIYGPPSPAAEKTLQSINALDQLEQLAERLVQVKSWDDLLST
ncbi:MAG: DUF4351 domain-containing protein [Armatimonadota bacterium]|nr:DUF4351 domain-containing protein [Armatimonadota bacterium]